PPPRRCHLAADVDPHPSCASANRQRPGLWYRALAQHPWDGGPAFVALSDSFFANLRRPARAEAHSVIGPQIRQGNRISRQSCGYILLAELLNAGHILRLFIGCL